MRKAKLFSHDAIIPRMSWSAHNLYNLIARSTVPFHIAGTDFSRTALTMYQQRWRAKRFLRGYHGDWIPERRFKRWFLPVDLPKLASSSGTSGSTSTSATHLPSRASQSGFGPRSQQQRAGAEDAASERSQMPTASLFMSEVERRLDVVVFRCCFARSAYEARNMIVHGKVKLNGQKVSDPNRLLTPGDLISVAPEAIPMLSKVLKQRAARRDSAKRKANPQPKKTAASPKVVEEEEEAGEGVTAEAGAEAEAPAVVEEGKDVEATTAEEDKDVEAAPAEEGKDVNASSDNAESDATAEDKTEKRSSSKGKGKAKSSEGEGGSDESANKITTQTAPGVRSFNLPPFAAPFLFIPSYLEPSFTTCSAIYLRHPTIVPASSSPSRSFSDSQQQGGGGGSSAALEFLSEIPSPYPASGDIFSMAWEHYARTAPRVRGDLRRLQLKAKVGSPGGGGGDAEGLGGMERERAKIVWKRMRAVRKGWARAGSSTTTTTTAAAAAATAGGKGKSVVGKAGGEALANKRASAQAQRA
ncbi:hypothetical protein A4X13_0g6695 [Tilletia indica]|uniref:RNA-binding S4 domain-containing protein n=1 Tax=Tilletia indica TaxID=43049 RepID=A0A177TWE2_9BASI|nr:hypothetical protein A4X13_0g6695 [Tilletia indica]